MLQLCLINNLMLDAPWCGHCKQLEPEYANAAGQLASNDDVKLVKVDATVEGDLATQYEVGGYPTLKFYKNGNKDALEYGGGRTADEIVSWITKKSGPAAVVINGADAAKSALEEHDAIVVIFSDDDSVFMGAADSYDDIVFGVLDEAAAGALDVSKDQISIFKSFDDGRVDYDGDGTQDDLIKFIKLESMPLINEFNEETAPKIFGGDIMQHLLMFAAKSADGYQSDYGW